MRHTFGLMRDAPKTKNALGSVLDREAVAGAVGAHVTMGIVIPSAWAADGATVTVAPKKRLVCARCDGGGCDGCGRGGAVVLSDDDAARSFTVVLPAGMGEVAAVRVPRPFGKNSPIGLAVCVVRVGDVATGCALVSSAEAPRGARPALVWAAPLVAIVLALVAALVASGR